MVDGSRTSKSPTYNGPDRRREVERRGDYRNEASADMSQLPLWVRAIATIGVPSAIAIFLVYVGSNELPKLNRQVFLIYEEVQRLKEATRDVNEQSQALYRMAQRLCSNTAKSDEERQRCFDK